MKPLARDRCRLGLSAEHCDFIFTFFGSAFMLGRGFFKFKKQVPFSFLLRCFRRSEVVIRKFSLMVSS
jgi:hypothetical protein